MFNERKAAQMAAYLLHKRGGTMSHLKLMKLLYLADREAMDRYGAPISGDLLVAMPHGPALSNTLNHMDGDVESSPGGWTDWISDQADYELRLRNPVSPEDLDELSEAELDVLDAVWEQFGSMGRWVLRDYTHTHCPEWEDPRGSSNPIPYKSE
ncbi:Panacea domain-containing protein [Candidatus Thiosymbion oneisti]|uniref:Panacea domain-containing protein n=1 Tax=Candidatus Thiosymbion oneisti TaxID=589554 RepID=UPI000B2FF984|nr:Panacea domain-containing protein [Candidatus Thiosymbion oneisti]